MKMPTDFKMPFGKYKDCSLDELTPEYINYLLCQEWFTGSNRDIVSDYAKQSNCELTLNFGKYKGKKISEVDDESYKTFLKDKKIVAQECFRF